MYPHGRTWNALERWRRSMWVTTRRSLMPVAITLVGFVGSWVMWLGVSVEHDTLAPLYVWCVGLAAVMVSWEAYCYRHRPDR